MSKNKRNIGGPGCLTTKGKIGITTSQRVAKTVAAANFAKEQAAASRQRLIDLGIIQPVQSEKVVTVTETVKFTVDPAHYLAIKAPVTILRNNTLWAVIAENSNNLCLESFATLEGAIKFCTNNELRVVAVIG